MEHRNTACAAWRSSDLDLVACGRFAWRRPPRNGRLDRDTEGIRSIRYLAKHRIEPSALLQCLVRGGRNGPAEELKRIQKVALAGSVRAHQDRQRSQANITLSNGLVVPKTKTADERRSSGGGAVLRRGLAHDLARRS